MGLPACMRAHAASVHSVLLWVKLILHKYHEADLAILTTACQAVVQCDSQETSFSNIEYDFVPKGIDILRCENHWVNEGHPLLYHIPYPSVKSTDVFGCSFANTWYFMNLLVLVPLNNCKLQDKLLYVSWDMLSHDNDSLATSTMVQCRWTLLHCPTCICGTPAMCGVSITDKTK